MDKAAYKEHLEKGKTSQKINHYFSRDHYLESIIQEFLWFLFRDAFSFTAKNMPDKSNYPTLQSNFKVFYLFKFHFQFDSDELTGVCIQCNCCKKKQLLCKFSEKYLIEVPRVLIKSVVFNHNGLL